MAEDGSEGLRDRIARQGEDALGKLAQDLLENPLVSSAISRAFGARERAVQAQEAAMGALNLPSAADIERLTRRLRSVSQRLEGIEDAVDRLDQRLDVQARAEAAQAGVEDRLVALDAHLSKLAGEVAHLAAALDTGPRPVPREQERFDVHAAPAADEEPIPPAQRARAKAARIKAEQGVNKPAAKPRAPRAAKPRAAAQKKA